MANTPPTHIIYISGLGDGYDRLRTFLLSFWRVYGVTVEFIPTKWANDEVYSQKISRITDAVQAAHDHGRHVVLIGESAGGSLALNAYAELPQQIHRLITLCGKNTRPDKVSPVLYRRNVAFKDSMLQAEVSAKALTKEQRQRMTSVYPLFDPTVPVEETFIPDCHRIRIWSVGHITSILFGLTVGAIILVREAKRS